MQGRITRLPLLAIALLSACGGEPAGPVGVAVITIVPDSVNLTLFDTLRLHATFKDAHGNSLPDRPVGWSSSNPNTVFVLETGRVQAVARGSAVITATTEGVSGTAKVRVVAPVTTITVTPNAATLFVDDTLRLHASLFSIDGGPPTDSAVTWSSSDTTTATVSSGGLVTGRGFGSTTISAAAGPHQGSALLTVNSHVASVSISPHDTSVHVFDLIPLVTIARDAGGDTLSQWQDHCPAGCRVLYPVSLQNLDTTVARFVSCCTLEGRRSGTDTIVGTADGISGRAIVHVSPLALTNTSVGNYQACGLAADSTAYCWASDHPRRATNGQHLVDVAAGEYAVCGLTPSGLPLCFVDTTLTPRGAPTSTRIDVGGTFLCGLTATASIWCTGVGSSGQLGSGVDTSYTRDAQTVTGGHTFASVSTGEDHVCALAAGGTAYCWGSNGAGMLGSDDSTLTHRAVPVLVAGNLTFVQVSAGAAHSCGVTTSGDGYCWGNNSHGELGTGDSVARRAPAPVSVTLHFLAISAGINHTCGIANGGAAYCWGATGTLGNGPDGSPTPVTVSGGLTFSSIQAGHGANPGSEATCGGTTNGVYCWGLGVTGVGGLSQSLTPIRVEGQP